MKSYIGSKIIKATPMTDVDFSIERGILHDAELIVQRYKIGHSLICTPDCGHSVCSNNQREPKQGYKVMYPGGYTSWSPKEVFEEAYRLISKLEKDLINQ